MTTAAVQGGLQPPIVQRPGHGRPRGASVDLKINPPPVSGRSSTSHSRPQTPIGPSGRPLVGRSSSTSSTGHGSNLQHPPRLTPSPVPSSASTSNPYPSPPRPHHQHVRQYSFPLGTASSVSLHRSGGGSSVQHHSSSSDHRNPYSFARFRDPFESAPSGTGSSPGSGNSGVGGVSSTASKLMTSVKRTLSLTAKKLDTRPTYPYATPYETAFDVHRRAPPAAPPTLAEIAQGLIPTRTPTPKRTPRPPTPPLVSSLKRTDRDSSLTKTSSSTASASSSSMPTTPTSSLASRTAPVRKKLGFALSRFYSRDSKSGSGTPALPPGTSPADSSVSLPRKAVRFSVSGGHGGESAAGHGGSSLDLPDSSEWSRSTSALGMTPPGLEVSPSEMSRSTSALGRSASEHGHGPIGRVTMSISEYAFVRRTFGRSRDVAVAGAGGDEANAAGTASSPSAFRLFNR